MAGKGRHGRGSRELDRSSRRPLGFQAVEGTPPSPRHRHRAAPLTSELALSRLALLVLVVGDNLNRVVLLRHKTLDNGFRGSVLEIQLIGFASCNETEKEISAEKYRYLAGCGGAHRGGRSRRIPVSSRPA